MWYILCNPVQCYFCIKRRKCRRIDLKSITDWKDGDQYFNKDGNPDGNRATTFSIGRQDRTSKSRHAKPKKQVWQHQRATKFGLPDYSTQSKGWVQCGRLNKGPKWLKASKNSVIPWKCLQFPHHKISSSHIEQEHSWEMLVTKSQNHPFCANLILRVFTVFFTGSSRFFHGFFKVFSRCH